MMSVCEEKEVWFCGKHRFKTTDHYMFILHEINEHDVEHGLWQAVGSKPWQWTNLKTGEVKLDYGKFRYLDLYNPRVGKTHSYFICWDKTGHKLEPFSKQQFRQSEKHE